MKRRKFVAGMVFSPFGSAFAMSPKTDCRDERGMMMPEETSAECLALEIVHRRTLGSRGRGVKVAVASFHFGAYEALLAAQRAKEPYPFTSYGKEHKIRVTRLSVAPDVKIGCVVCEVQGRLL